MSNIGFIQAEKDLITHLIINILQPAYAATYKCQRIGNLMTILLMRGNMYNLRFVIPDNQVIAGHVVLQY